MRFTAACVLLACFAMTASAADAPPHLRVGAAAAALEADDSMVIAGGIGPGKATGQEGELRATAVVIERQPFGKVALVSCDVLFVTRDFVDRALAQIQARTGVAPDRVLVSATHTHHAPSTAVIHGYGRDEVFTKRLEAAIVKAVCDADAKLRAGDAGGARFFFALGEEKTVGVNSRLLLKDGTIYWVGPMDDAVRPTGPFDPQLPALAFKRADSDKLLALVFNHSTHTIGTRKGPVRSPGFYGLAAQELEAETGGVCCFLEGASGSTHNLGAVTTAQAVDRLKAAVRATLSDAKQRPVDRLASRKRPFTFRVRTFDEEVEDQKVSSYCRKRAPAGADYTIGVFRDMRRRLAPEQGKERQTFIQAVVIGDVAIVGVPAEYFTGLGMDIKKRSPFPDTIVAELANDWIGYLPDREAHTLGGYQTWTGFHSYAEVGTGERVADEAVALLNELEKAAAR